MHGIYSHLSQSTICFLAEWKGRRQLSLHITRNYDNLSSPHTVLVARTSQCSQLIYSSILLLQADCNSGDHRTIPCRRLYTMFKLHLKTGKRAHARTHTERKGNNYFLKPCWGTCLYPGITENLNVLTRVARSKEGKHLLREEMWTTRGKQDRTGMSISGVAES